MGKPFLQLHLVDHCNLNCKGCAHFSPIADMWFISIEETKQMLSALQPVMEKWFCRIELMGGEPLLHPDIEKIMELTRCIYPDFEIRLVTNGLRLRVMPKSFFLSCRKNKVEICISVYPVSIDYQSVNSILERFGIMHRTYGDFQGNKVFIDYKLNPNGTENSEESYKLCKHAGHCVQLRDGRIYPCFIVAYSETISSKSEYIFEISEDDYLSLELIGTDTNIDDKFRNLIYRPIPFCRYCSLSKESTCEWDYSKREVMEWITKTYE